MHFFHPAEGPGMQRADRRLPSARIAFDGCGREPRLEKLISQPPRGHMLNHNSSCHGIPPLPGVPDLTSQDMSPQWTADFQSLATAEQQHRDRAECAADGQKPSLGNPSANSPILGRWPRCRIRCTCCQSQLGRPWVAYIELAKLERETTWTRMPGCTLGPSQLFNRCDHVSDP